MRAQAYVPLPEIKKVARGVWALPAVGAGVAALAAWGWISFKGGESAPAAASSGPDLVPISAAPAPQAAPSPRAPELASAVSAPAALPSISPAAFSGAALAAFEGRAAAPAAWTRTPELRWQWPTQVLGFSSGVTGIRAASAPRAAQRLAGWFPENPKGRQLQFAVLGEDGSQRKLYEEELAAPAAPPAVGFKLGGLAAALAGANRAVDAVAADVGWLVGGMSLAQIRQKELEALRKKTGAAAARGYLDANGRPMAELTYEDGRKEVVPYDPLVFDLKGTGVKTSERKTLFDLYGYRKADKIQWMNDVDDGTGILVFDSDGSGRSGKTGAEVFGDRTDLSGVGRPDGFINGFAALRALAEKAVRQGVIGPEALDRGVLEADSLASLEKAYGLGMRVGGFNGRTVSLREAGVRAIALSQAPVRRVEDFDGRRNDLLLQPGAMFLRADGSAGAYMNVWLVAKTGNLGLAGK